MGKGDGGGAIAGLLLGLVGAAVVVTVIAGLSTPKCPVCGNQIPKGANPCPHCLSWLTW